MYLHICIRCTTDHLREPPGLSTPNSGARSSLGKRTAAERRYISTYICMYVCNSG